MQYFVLLMALFQGRIFDKPEQAMGGTQYSTGGEVEHEVCMSFPYAGSLLISSRSS